MSIVSYPNLVFSINNMPKLTCMTCGEPMMLILVEDMPRSTDFDLRTFKCTDCDIVETFVIDISGQ